MARKLRIEYPGAIYHVINRGNYRRDLFESVGAAEAFLRVLFETTGQFGWRVYAYVLMRNHCKRRIGCLVDSDDSDKRIVGLVTTTNRAWS
jgi:REP element-mobilizing transposase RayT